MKTVIADFYENRAYGQPFRFAPFLHVHQIHILTIPMIYTFIIVLILNLKKFKSKIPTMHSIDENDADVKTHFPYFANLILTVRLMFIRFNVILLHNLLTYKLNCNISLLWTICNICFQRLYLDELDFNYPPLLSSIYIAYIQCHNKGIPICTDTYLQYYTYTNNKHII